MKTTFSEDVERLEADSALTVCDHAVGTLAQQALTRSRPPNTQAKSFSGFFNDACKLYSVTSWQFLQSGCSHGNFMWSSFSVLMSCSCFLPPSPLLESKNSPPFFARIPPLASWVDASSQAASDVDRYIREVDGDGYVGEVYVNVGKPWRSEQTESVTFLPVVNMQMFCYALCTE